MNTEKPLKKKRKLRKSLLIVVSILIVARILLPTIVLKYVNNSLEEMEGYYGHVDDIDIALIRGAYVIKDINIVKKVDKANSDRFDTIPFFAAKNVDLSIEWRAIFDGKIVGEIVINESSINFVKDKISQEDIATDTTDFRILIKNLMPLKINNLEVYHSEIHYLDPYSNPKLDIFTANLTLTATNLTNTSTEKELLPSKVNITSDIYEGKFQLEMGLDAFAIKPTFDVNASLTKLNIVKLNNFFKAYGNFDAERGVFSAYGEAAAKQGQISGYVKPLMSDLKIYSRDEDKGNITQKLWEGLLGVGFEIFENQRKDQFATKIKIKGDISNPKINILGTIGGIMRNAFLKAMQAEFDRTININDLEDEDKTFIEKIVDRKNEKKAKRKSK